MEIPITKLDAARRQLETAIVLFFHNGDPISIHALSAAAHEVICTLAHRRGLTPILTNLADVKPEYRNEVSKMLRTPQNFLKHANKDPEGTLSFETEQAPFFIWEASYLYQKLTQERLKHLAVFDLWFFTEYPDILQPQYRALLKLPDTGPVQNKEAFFESASKAFDQVSRIMKSSP